MQGHTGIKNGRGPLPKCLTLSKVVSRVRSHTQPLKDTKNKRCRQAQTKVIKTNQIRQPMMSCGLYDGGGAFQSEMII